MKCTIPEISWHNRDPVLSVDIQCSSSNKNFYRLATGGNDAHVLIWQLAILENGAVSVEMLSDLTRHTKSVNAVRFSPNGQILASSDDDAAIILWKKSDDSTDIFADENEKENKEYWSVLKMFRNHLRDIYDLCWSSCSGFLISGSVDNSAILWDVHKGKSKAIIDHKGFVQGVSWDPKGRYVATLSSDRFLRVFNISNDKIKLVHKTHKSVLNSDDPSKKTRLFYDDTLKSFCRRLSFSPDGELLVTPSGILEEDEGKYSNVSHIFTVPSFNRPVICLPNQDKFTIAVRFCPILFSLREIKCSEDDLENASYKQLFNLPYRMVFAVATQNSVVIYDTQQPVPFAKVSNMHYARLSDVSWSSDGRILVVSSTDGYCSLLSFSERELGIPYEGSKENNHQESPVNSSSCTNSSHCENEKMDVDEDDIIEPTKREFLEKEQINQKKREIKSMTDKVAKPIAIKRKNGKRVELITLTKKANEKSKDKEATTCEEKAKVEEQTDIQMSPKISEEKAAKTDHDPSKRKSEDESNNTKTDDESNSTKTDDESNSTKTDDESNNTKTDKDPSKTKSEDESNNTKTDDESNNKESITEPLPVPSQKTPRRVSLITLSSPKSKNLNS